MGGSRVLRAGLALVTCAALASCGVLDRKDTRGRHLTATSASPTPTGSCSVSELLVPSCGAWWGVAPGALTDVPARRALAEFEGTIGRTVDMVHMYVRAPKMLPRDWVIKFAQEPGTDRLLLINWKPEMGRSWAEVAAGDPDVDAYIDKLSAYIKKNFPYPFFLAIHAEPENEIEPAAGSGYTAADYAAMYRHVVERMQANGVSNAVFVMTYMGAPKWGKKQWFEHLYPGDDVVDWLGYDPYAGPGTDTFAQLVNKRYAEDGEWPGFYAWAEEHIPDKPIMLSEWGVFTDPRDPGHKAAFFRTVAKQIEDYPRLKALSYFDSPNAPKGNTIIDSTRAALEAYRKLSGHPYFNPPGPFYAPG